MPCPKCEIDPKAHSFEKLVQLKNGTNVFYTCPAKATDYRDEPMFLTYFKHHLELPGKNPWIWIFDVHGFGLKHCTSMDTMLGLMKMLETDHKDTLQAIYFVNESIHFHNLLTLIKPFLKKEHKARMHSIKGNSLHTLTELEKRGIPMTALSCLRY